MAALCSGSCADPFRVAGYRCAAERHLDLSGFGRRQSKNNRFSLQVNLAGWSQL